ncbi:MAG: DNA mismatch repair endonuclease MutL [Chitinophagaceae bacterium]
MPDIIQLLPDNIANQIAAGEVIQRPASAVKELLENAVDADATEIKLIVNDAGKALVQVIDNGKGMSTTDARMAFERHATSKIRSIEDLFRIKTMGFRGEALASIAAVAQVELKTKKADDELGTFIEIENSSVLKQEPIGASVGTSIAMKNLFFNVPARRNFLKSNPSELRHIIDEFIRVAMAFPEVHFSLLSNGQQVFFLEKGSLKQRIVQILGSTYLARLVPIQEDTDYLTIRGFVGKPETAKKTRGDQYFFVNNRFIKSAYLNHAVMGAFNQMIGKDSFPMYVLFIDLDPAQVDINVHPTKQEIKFEDEKIVYAFVQAAVKHALAQFSVAPSLDFTLDANIQQLDAVSQPFTDDKKQHTISSSLYNTFTQKNQAHKIEPSNLQPWKEMRQQERDIKEAISRQSTDSGRTSIEGTTNVLEPVDGQRSTADAQPWQSELAKLKEDFFKQSDKAAYNDFEHEQRPVSREQRFAIQAEAPLMQLHNTYIVAAGTNGYFLIHQQAAHERVLYEQFQHAMNGRTMASQRSLFPSTIELSPADTVMLGELLADLAKLGYLLEPFGSNTFVIQGTPADVSQGNEKRIMEQLLEQYKHFNSEVRFSKREKLIRSMAWQQCIKSGKSLTEKEMRALLEQLVLCQMPNATPSGNPTYISYRNDQLDKMFGK